MNFNELCVEKIKQHQLDWALGGGVPKGQARNPQ